MDKKTTDWSLIAKSIEEPNLENEAIDDEDFQNKLNECRQIWKGAFQVGQLKKDKEGFSEEKLNSCISMMKNKIEKAERTSMELKPQKSIHIPYTFIARVAASLLILVAVSFAVYQYAYVPFSNTPVELTTFKTTETDQKVVALPDGTRVWLNANSSLVYDSNFDKARRVTLKGEAFFEVISNPENPFIVQTGTVYTKVLGTSFNLKAFSEESVIRMTVVEGNVEFGAENQTPIAVKTNQEVVFNKTAHSLNKVTLNAPANIAWKENKLAFNGITLEEVVGVLNRHYQKNVFLQGRSLDSLDFSTTSSMDFNDKSLKETLDIITLTLGVRYQETENGFIITP